MKKIVKLFSLVLVLLMSLSIVLVACDNIPDDPTYTRNNYLAVTPSTWNELTSTDSNNDSIMSYISSAFFEYDFVFEGGKFKADGSLNAEGIVDGAFEVKYSAATALTDVTAQYGDAWDLTEDQINEGGHVWKISLRNDLKWDDGTAIKADDFVYTMKEQLNPLFRNARADSYYANSVLIHNAKNYAYQGQEGWFDNNNNFTRDLLVKGSDGTYKLNGNDVVIPTTESLAWLGSSLADAIKEYGGTYMDAEAGAALLALAGADGRVAVTDESIALLEKLITTYPAWGETTDEIVQYMYYFFRYPELDFDKVGIFAVGDYDIVLVVDNPLTFYKEDGETLSYLAAYQFASLPLVKKDLYESCKVAPQSGSTLWTSKYCTTVETSASWGPYKLTEFQAGKQFVLERNEHWYGYALEDNKGQYQTDKIITQVIAKEEAQQLAFWSGEVDSLGIATTIADDYKNSPFAIFSPRTAIFGIQVYSNLPVLKNSPRNNGVLAIKEFREAMSWSLDRKAYAKDLSTANQPALGLLSEDYYHDVENSGIYRNTPQAKAALLRSYGYSLNSAGKWTDGVKVYEDIDAATESMTGVNNVLAKEKVEEAYNILMADPAKYGYDATKPIQICYGDADDGELSGRYYNFIKSWIENLIKGTSFEGKIEVTKDFTLGNQWSEKFKAGEYDLSTSGVGNAPFDPFYFIGAQINQSEGVSYHRYWDVDHEMVEFTLPAGDFAGAGQTLKLTVTDWYNSLNGYTSYDQCSYNWKNAPVEVRLEILAMLEEYGLQQYYCLPTVRGFTATLRSAKSHYITEVENVMVSFGGIRYLTYDYNNGDWQRFVKKNNGDLREFYK